MRLRTSLAACCLAVASLALAAPASASIGCEPGDPNCNTLCSLVDRLPKASCNT